MSNSVFAAATIAILAAHLGVLAWSVARRRVAAPMLLLNAGVAVCVLAYLMQHGVWRQSPADPQLLALDAFEIAVLALAVAARRSAPARIGSAVVFAVHIAASGAAVAFALLFRITRLI